MFDACHVLELEQAVGGLGGAAHAAEDSPVAEMLITAMSSLCALGISGGLELDISTCS